MNTGEVLDLFKVSADSEQGKGKAGKAAGGPMTTARILEG
jgi:TATA-binding protein-associated factor